MLFIITFTENHRCLIAVRALALAPTISNRESGEKTAPHDGWFIRLASLVRPMGKTVVKIIYRPSRPQDLRRRGSRGTGTVSIPTAAFSFDPTRPTIRSARPPSSHSRDETSKNRDGAFDLAIPREAAA
jgi:hypothetical protein